MYKLSILLLVLSGVVVFGADRLYHKGKIKNLKQLLIIKSSGLLATIIAVILLIYFKQ
ncbi:hypothetical protein PV797_14695 [Clostridiaceae bacterium M8S5]|nr:hypothetical protein PV797_14695 [Clostridiaceae bacterium M8S5]